MAESTLHLRLSSNRSGRLTPSCRSSGFCSAAGSVTRRSRISRPSVVGRTMSALCSVDSSAVLSLATVVPHCSLRSAKVLERLPAGASARASAPPAARSPGMPPSHEPSPAALFDGTKDEWTIRSSKPERTPRLRSIAQLPPVLAICFHLPNQPHAVGGVAEKLHPTDRSPGNAWPESVPAAAPFCGDLSAGRSDGLGQSV